MSGLCCCSRWCSIWGVDGVLGFRAICRFVEWLFSSASCSSRCVGQAGLEARVSCIMRFICSSGWGYSSVIW